MSKSTIASLIFLLITTAVAGPKTLAPLTMRMQVVGTEHCQLGPSTQGLELQVKLLFVNRSDESLTIQDIGWPGLVLVAKTASDIEKGTFEIESHGEDFEFHPPQNRRAIPLRPGESYATKQTVALTVAQGTRSGLQVEPGAHYLQVGDEVTLGADDPRTWKSISLRSTPIAIKIDYTRDASPCTQK